MDMYDVHSYYDVGLFRKLVWGQYPIWLHLKEQTKRCW